MIAHPMHTPDAMKLLFHIRNAARQYGLTIFISHVAFCCVHRSVEFTCDALFSDGVGDGVASGDDGDGDGDGDGIGEKPGLRVQ